MRHRLKASSAKRAAIQDLVDPDPANLNRGFTLGKDGGLGIEASIKLHSFVRCLVGSRGMDRFLSFHMNPPIA